MNNSYGSYLEELRTSRKLTKEKFVEGIMSERQYRRYLNDESQIPNDKLVQLIDRLQIDFFSFQTSFERRTEKNLQEIRNVYHEIRKRNFKNASDLLKTIDFVKLTGNYERDFFTHCSICISYELKTISKSVALQNFKELINFPICFEKKSLNFIELSSLMWIISLNEDRMINLQIGTFLYNHLSDDDFIVVGANHFLLPAIYAGITRLLVQLAEYEKAMIIARLGIEYCDKYDLTFGMKSLLYFSAHSCIRLGKSDDGKEYITRLKHLLDFKYEETSNKKYLEAIKNLLE